VDEAESRLGARECTEEGIMRATIAGDALPALLATAVGSVPHIDPNSAVDMILGTLRTVPHTAQLPRCDPREQMWIQFSEKVPRFIGDTQRLTYFFDTSGDPEAEVERFYTEYLSVVEGGSPQYFSVGHEYGRGIWGLLERLRKGAPGAVDELLRQYQGKIFNLAMSILKNESDAEEAAQDVFMTVIRKVDTFKGNSAFYSWMYRICVNTCLMRLRGKRRNDTVAIEEFMPVFTEDGMHASPMDDWSKEVERKALNEELGTMIRKFTEELSEKYRVVFVLSDIEGLSNEETAKVLGMTVPAVKSRLHRARLYLREQLSRYLKEGKVE